MLSGDDDSVDFLGLHRTIGLLFVLNCHLSLAIWSKPPQLTTLTHISESLTETRGHGMSQRHGIFGFITGITEHDALVTCTHIHLLFAHMHATCNVRALFVDTNKHFTSLVTPH